ncbi:MAG: hypothetical protein WAT23_15065 [Chromatiaceae bacterium]
MYTPLRDVRNYVTHQEPFTGNNIFAEQRDYAYAVYSYRFNYPILINIAGIWFENSTKYSMTTTRHLSSARPFHVNPRPLPVDAMNDLLNPRTPAGSAMQLLALADRATYGVSP